MVTLEDIPTCLIIEQRILTKYFNFYFMAIEVNPRNLSFALDYMSHQASDHWFPETLTDVTDL